ncbi:hypothetical protein LCGC14_0911340 [marine sediment metagenome]
MSRALEIARNGLGTTAPNPMVGAVIVFDEKIIGEGFTSPFGGAHAEVNAIASVADKAQLKHATLFVTLEPCSHFGKTPPCVDLILQHKIPTVCIGVSDPHEKVAGQGIDKLRKAGVDVTTGVLASECREHHKRFLTFHEKKRPYIILKWAQTADHFIAPDVMERHKNPEPYWISNAYSRQLTHKWRSEEQAILVGTNTVVQDNPKLDVRQWSGKNPRKIVLDRTLRIPGDYQVMKNGVAPSAHTLPTLVLTEATDASRYLEGVDYDILCFSKDVAGGICKILYEQNIISILIEGGAKTLQTFIDAYLWDEARVFTGASHFKSGTKAPDRIGKLVVSKYVGTDTLKIYHHD